MNIFRLAGDVSHLLAIIILLVKIWRSRSCAGEPGNRHCWKLVPCSPVSLPPLGISGKSQVLFALVFITRYLDLVTSFISVYNTCMKIFFILSTFATLYLVFFKFKATYDSNNDTFRAELLVIPVAGLSVLVNHEFSIMEVRMSTHLCVTAKGHL